MNTVIPGRFTADFDRSLVIFVIGMRINHFHKVGKWLPVARAMGPMIEELARNPQSGFLGTEFMLRNLRTVVLMQYWRDFDSLEAYETIYGNMPPFGLGKVAGLIPATGKRNEARSRMKTAVEG